MSNDVDILETDVVKDWGKDVMEILLTDRSVTAAKNDGKTHHIFWATNDYEERGSGYGFFDEISIDSITGDNSNVIMPRVLKRKALQKKRVKEKAEIFTPAWVCNMMINNLDERYFGHRDVFNNESEDQKQWTTIPDKVQFPEGKTWQDYVKVRWMEFCCGEAPFIVSRYDAVSGKPIPIKDRIGFLDRKLRIVCENTNGSEEWLKGARSAYQNTLGNEWQGDSLLLARENLLYTFIDYYEMMFNRKPAKSSVKVIADIISWNIFQMDGLKFVVPCSCHDVVTTNLLGEKEVHPCPGCKTGDKRKHNGIYPLIKAWRSGGTYPFKVCIKDNR